MDAGLGDLRFLHGLKVHERPARAMGLEAKPPQTVGARLDHRAVEDGRPEVGTAPRLVAVDGDGPPGGSLRHLAIIARRLAGGSNLRESDVVARQTGQVSLWEAWEQRAEAWIKWARTPGHDGFWLGTWPELCAVLPPPPGVVIEIGCGEGRVGRELLRLGYRVVGVERSPTLARAAWLHEMPLTVLRADAALLPVSEASADVAVACMSLHDVDDLRATVNEAWRVLRPGGCLCVSLVHPFATAYDPVTMHTERPVVTAPYLRERRFEDRVTRDGLEMTFVSVHRPLRVYFSAFLETGFAIDALREFGAKPIPWLMTLRLKKPVHPGG